MQPTSLKLPDKLKKRFSALAEESGKSLHAVLLDALEAHAGLLEKRREFIADALAADAEMDRTGEYYDGDEVLAWARARAAGKKAKQPKLRKWRK
jgi:predicted transcriptional regulator